MDHKSMFPTPTPLGIILNLDTLYLLSISNTSPELQMHVNGVTTPICVSLRYGLDLKLNHNKQIQYIAGGGLHYCDHYADVDH
jgi:hypothetical protein